jgi:hypothetical protein
MLLLASAAAEGPCGLRAADVTLRPGMGPARQHNEYLVLKKLMVLSDNGTALPHTLQKAGECRPCSIHTRHAPNSMLVVCRASAASFPRNPSFSMHR